MLNRKSLWDMQCFSFLDNKILYKRLMRKVSPENHSLDDIILLQVDRTMLSFIWNKFSSPWRQLTSWTSNNTVARVNSVKLHNALPDPFRWKWKWKFYLTFWNNNPLCDFRMFRASPSVYKHPSDNNDELTLKLRCSANLRLGFKEPNI